MPLEIRRHRSDLIETFKIINGCYNLQSDLFFLHLRRVKEEDIRRSCIKRSRLDLRKYVFSNRVIDRWNALADVCVLIALQ